MKYFLLFMILVLNSAFSSEKIISIKYVKSFFAGIHQNQSKYSVVLTTVNCGFPVKVLEEPKALELKYHKVKVGMHTGYIKSDLISNEQEQCYQDKYPRFLDGVDMDLESMHYFGRLYDLYVKGESRAR